MKRVGRRFSVLILTICFSSCGDGLDTLSPDVSDRSMVVCGVTVFRKAAAQGVYVPNFSFTALSGSAEEQGIHFTLYLNARLEKRADEKLCWMKVENGDLTEVIENDQVLPIWPGL